MLRISTQVQPTYELSKLSFKNFKHNFKKLKNYQYKVQTIY